MAEEIENNETDNAIVPQESEDHTASEDLEADGQTDGPETEGDAPSGNENKSSSKGLWRLKYILGALILIIFAVTWAGTRFKADLLNMVYKKEQIIHLSDLDMENLTEEILQPIFIPVGQDAAEGLMRIDFSVIWDGLASVRYDKKRLLIRDRLFRDISTAATQIEDPGKNGEIMENAMGSIMREMLGINNLVIKIKEIKYF